MIVRCAPDSMKDFMAASSVQSERVQKVLCASRNVLTARLPFGPPRLQYRPECRSLCPSNCPCDNILHVSSAYSFDARNKGDLGCPPIPAAAM